MAKAEPRVATAEVIAAQKLNAEKQAEGRGHRVGNWNLLKDQYGHTWHANCLNRECEGRLTMSSRGNFAAGTLFSVACPYIRNRVLSRRS